MTIGSGIARRVECSRVAVEAQGEHEEAEKCFRGAFKLRHESRWMIGLRILCMLCVVEETSLMCSGQTGAQSS